MDDDSWQTYSNTLRRLLERPRLLQQFQEELDGTATSDLNLTAEMRTDIKQLLLSLSSYQAPPAEASAPGGQGSGGPGLRGPGLTREHLLCRVVLRVDLRASPPCGTRHHLGEHRRLPRRRSPAGHRCGPVHHAGRGGGNGDRAGRVRTGCDRDGLLSQSGEPGREFATAVQQSSMILMSYMLGLNLVSKSLSGMRMSDESVM